MSLKPHEFEPIPEETKRIAWKTFRKGSLIMRLRDALGTIYHDEDFRDLFERRGKPAESPWRLALVTVMQAVENLTDRQAADMVRARIDWKYALSLPLDDEGFDFSVLSAFRDRLLSADVTEKVLTPLLNICWSQGWLKVNQQRTDSTHILAAVRDLSRVECVGETFRATLNDLAERAPDWLLQVVSPAWFEQYVNRIDLYRISKNVKKQQQWRDQMGQDAWTLLQACRRSDAPAWLKDEASIHLLQQIWDQHFERRENTIVWRASPAVSNAEQILSPYDIQARAGCKREREWTGYKCHITETCSRDPEHLSLIVQVETTSALVADATALPPILEDVQARGVGSREHWVDQGYMSGEQIVAQRAMQRELIGPVGLAQGWQNRAEGGITAEAFLLDRERHVATCPQGKESLSWREKRDTHGKQGEEIRFSIKDCRDCPIRERCSRGQRVGRILFLLPIDQRAALQERRAEQETEAYRQKYALRAGIESTISQAVRTTGLRQSPYRGQRKTHQYHVVIATALNLVRIDQKLMRDQGLGARPRPLSPFKKLEKRARMECPDN